MNPRIFRSLLAATALVVICAPRGSAQAPAHRTYEHEDTRALVALVDDAAALVAGRGDSAFAELRTAGSRWRQADTYVFVLEPDGNMLIHPDPSMEGKNELGLKDVKGRPIIRGLIAAATTSADKPAGWYHYEWPVPGGLLPRWKTSYVRLVVAPSGKRYIVGSGVYNDRMERAFVVDAVTDAVAQIEQRGEAAYPLFHDATGPFMAKDAYVFVIDPQGVDLVNPAFPNLEGRNLLDVKDTSGKALVREMLDVVQTRGSGWVDYMWPKPGESVSTQKSTFVTKAKIGSKWVMVGSGVYLADAPKAARTAPAITAPQLMALVREGAAEFQSREKAAFADFGQKGSKWFRDDTYFFVWTMTGTRVFHAADPTLAGQDVKDFKDVLGRPIGRMILEAAGTPSGEGWIHYMYPEPGNIFPIWKSTFVKRVTLRSGEQYAIGSGIYNMQTDRAFIEDVVDRAAALVTARGKDAFDELRDKKGPFVFMDTYVFVNSPDGMELVNPGQPSLEGTNLTGLKDVNGKSVADEYIALAMKNGHGWVDYQWYKPGHNTPALKHTYVRKVGCGSNTYIVGSGFYDDVDAKHTVPPTDKTPKLVTPIDLAWQIDAFDPRRAAALIVGDPAQPGPFAVRYRIPAGYELGLHMHPEEDEQLTVLSGAIRFSHGSAGKDAEERLLPAGSFVLTPAAMPHRIVAVEDSVIQLSGIGPRTYRYLNADDDPLAQLTDQ